MIGIKENIYDPVNTYNYVEYTNVSVLIKKLMPTNANKARYINLKSSNHSQRFIPDGGI